MITTRLYAPILTVLVAALAGCASTKSPTKNTAPTTVVAKGLRHQAELLAETAERKVVAVVPDSHMIGTPNFHGTCRSKPRHVISSTDFSVECEIGLFMQYAKSVGQTSDVWLIPRRNGHFGRPHVAHGNSPILQFLHRDDSLDCSSGMARAALAGDILKMADAGGPCLG